MLDDRLALLGEAQAGSGRRHRLWTSCIHILIATTLGDDIADNSEVTCLECGRCLMRWISSVCLFLRRRQQRILEVLPPLNRADSRLGHFLLFGNADEKLERHIIHGKEERFKKSGKLHGLFGQYNEVATVRRRYWLMSGLGPALR